MPELPEVETIRLGLEPVMVDRVIKHADIRRADLRIPFPADLSKILKGRKISRLSRRAKYLVFHLDKSGELLVVHLGMSGRMTIIKDMKEYVLKKHDHMILALDNGSGVAFNDARRFGMVMLLKEGEVADHPSFRLIGPEPLDKEFTGKVLLERLKGKSTPIKIALLDQRLVAGVGNIYASEALFEAGISPLRKASTLTSVEASRLAAAIKNVLTKAIAAGGSSLKDHRQADGSLGYFQHGFSVYGRKGEPCPRCKTGAKKKSSIEKIVQSARATYFCPVCQI